MARTDEQSSPPQKRRRNSNNVIDIFKVKSTVFEDMSMKIEKTILEPNSEQQSDSESDRELEQESKPKPESEAVEQQIDSLDQKILIEIFQYLDFIDFLNVANTTKKLRNAARIIYHEKYANKEVKFNADVVDKKSLVINESAIAINDARMCLKIFRAFGSIIQKITLNFNGIGPRRTHAISQMLNCYCARTLTQLEWNDCPADAMNASSEKFMKLKCLRLTNGSLGISMSQFNEFFPALRCLELDHMNVTNRKCIERTIPNLTHLNVHIDATRKNVNFLKSNVKASLKLNPQIRSLYLGSGCEPKMLTFINEMLPLLEQLKIQNPPEKFFDSDENAVTFKCVTHFSLDNVNCTDSFTNCPFKFKRLEQFTLNANCRYCDKWIDFVAQNRKICDLKLLNYNPFYLIDENNLMKIAVLPNLKHLVLDWRIDSTDSLFRFVDKCRSLQSMRLLLRTQSDRALICSKFSRSWNFEIEKNSVIFHRKEN